MLESVSQSWRLMGADCQRRERPVSHDLEKKASAATLDSQSDISMVVGRDTKHDAQKARSARIVSLRGLELVLDILTAGPFVGTQGPCHSMHRLPLLIGVAIPARAQAVAHSLNSS